MNQLRFSRAILFPVTAIVLAGCAATEPEPVYFVLTGSHSGMTRTHPASAVNVYVRRIEVPAYLGKLGLVTIEKGSEVSYADTYLWAEPLDQGLSRAVAEDLSQNSRFRAFGFSPTVPPPDHAYDVWIRLERFEGTGTGQAVLRVRWWVSTAGSSDSISGRTTEIRRSGWQPGNYGELIQLFRSEVQELSREIATAIP